MSKLTRYFQSKKEKAGVGKEGWESFEKQLVEKEKKSEEREKKLEAWYKRMLKDGEDLTEEEMAEYRAAQEEDRLYMKWRRETREQRAGVRAGELEKEMEGMSEDERFYFLARRGQEEYKKHKQKWETSEGRRTITILERL